MKFMLDYEQELDSILDELSTWKDSESTPVIKEHDGIFVVRDDLLSAGSKCRFIDKLVKDGPDEWVFGGANKVGWGPISLCYVANKYGKKCTFFMAKRKEPTWHQQKVLDLGGTIHWVANGMLNVTLARARDYANAEPTKRSVLPLGLEHPWVIGSIVKVARELPIKPDVVWSVGSSGTLNRGLQLAWPDAEVHVIQVGHKLSDREKGRAILHTVPYAYDKAVKPEHTPPFPSAPEYDAKAWHVVQQFADKSKINLLWNVAK
jgi:hypothetical protein